MAVLNLKIRLRDFCKTVLTIDGVTKALAKVWKAEEGKDRVPSLLEEIIRVIVKSFGHNKAILSQINTELDSSGKFSCKSILHTIPLD